MHVFDSTSSSNDSTILLKFEYPPLCSVLGLHEATTTVHFGVLQSFSGEARHKRGAHY